MNDDVNRAVREWLSKAEGDWETVQILAAHPVPPLNSLCFHCQQFAEKLLKAFLTLHGIEAPRTHNLRRLIQLAESHLPGISKLADASDRLTVHAVDTRYPGAPLLITREQAQSLIELAGTFRERLLPVLLPDQ